MGKKIINFGAVGCIPETVCDVYTFFTLKLDFDRETKLFFIILNELANVFNYKKCVYFYVCLFPYLNYVSYHT